MDSYSYDTLSKLIDDQISVRDKQGNKVLLTLIEVSQHTLNDDDWESFSVLYLGDNNFRIPQGTYTFEHSGFGKKEIFLTPKSETEYETVITRKRRGSEKVKNATPEPIGV